MDDKCFTRQIFIKINEDNLAIFRCCYFTNFEENCQHIKFSELPESDEEFAKLINEKARIKPPTFRDLIPRVQKHCNISCNLCYSEEPAMVMIHHFGCNLRCKMCAVGPIKPTEEMKKVHARVLKVFKDIPLLFTTQQGEPFLEKKLIFEILENKKEGRMIATSNLTLLNDDDIEKLAQYKDKFSLISSVDSVSENIYCTLRTPANSNVYHKVISNFEKLASYGLIKENNVTITPWNLDLEDLEKTFNWAKNLGVDTQFGVDSGNLQLLNDPVVLFLKEKHPTNWRT